MTGSVVKVVLADVEHEALSAAQHEFRTQGSTVLAVRTDVSKASDVEQLAARAVAVRGGEAIRPRSPRGVSYYRRRRSVKTLKPISALRPPQPPSSAGRTRRTPPAGLPDRGDGCSSPAVSRHPREVLAG